MSATTEERIGTLLNEAERSGACCVPEDRATRAAMRRRSDMVVEPIRGLFFRAAAWERLEPPERMKHLMRALAHAHPTWKFQGPSAAVAYGLPVTWSLLDNVSIAASPGPLHYATSGIYRHHISDETIQMHDGLPLVPFWRTVFDCLATFELPDALAVADSALRMRGVSARGLTSILNDSFSGRRGVKSARQAAVLADARAESGGESIARATMFQLGFARPELQVWIEDPVEPGTWFRVDFLWLTEAEKLIIGELDGRQKTSRPELMSGRDALHVMQDERFRESHLTALRPAIVRFPYEVARDPEQLGPLLERYGVPRDPDSWPTEPPRTIVTSSRLDYGGEQLRIVRATTRA